MSPRQVLAGIARSSSQPISNWFSTKPKMRRRHFFGSIGGTLPTWRTGKPVVTVWPGGTVGSFCLRKGIAGLESVERAHDPLSQEEGPPGRRRGRARDPGANLSQRGDGARLSGSVYAPDRGDSLRADDRR